MEKICLINPPTTIVGDLYFPMGLVNLGTVLKKQDFPCEIIDFDIQLREETSLAQWDLFKDYALKKLEKAQAKVFGISSLCANFPLSLLLAKEIRRYFPSSMIIFGGPQPSSAPVETLRKFPEIDLIVVGEGENTLLELAALDFKRDRLPGIRGIVFRDGNQITTNPARELISDLDEIPPPDFSLLSSPIEKYLKISPYTALIEAGRGCPFLCSFCSTSVMWSRKFRLKSPARVLVEMRYLHDRFGIKEFPITHDNFTTKPHIIKEFCKYFKANNHEDFVWSVSARTDTITPELISLMREAGCGGLYFGVDTGSPRIQKVIKKHLKLDQFKEHLKLAVSQGFSCTTSFVVGFPEESPEDLEQTLQLGLWAKLAGASIFQCYPLAPLSRTPIYEQNHSNIKFDTQRIWSSACAVEMPFSKENPEIVKLIASQPSLFSSFYYVPTPLLGSLSIPEIAFFYLELINNRAPRLNEILNDTQWSMLELFARWVLWVTFFHRGKSINGKFILDTFEEFLEISLKEPDLETYSFQLAQKRVQGMG